MASAYSFAVPSAVPQDLQLIQDLIGDIPVPTTSKLSEASARSDPDHGTDSDTDSEQEVEAGILVDVGEGDVDTPSESTSDSDSSSDSEDEEDVSAARKARQKPVKADMDEDDDGEPAATSEAQLRTKNEVIEAEVIIPEVAEISPDQRLEKVGEIMNIVDKVVIVKGVASEVLNRGSEKALDSDTLLVFEDRKVFGYIFETFGPTSEPLYQVRFNQRYPLDPEKVQVGRPVFHVPTQSHYVFVQQLRHFKGSDASNVNDEEPADDELEFSDDEAEAAHKRALAQRREQSRARSVMSSRHSTPVPSRMRDQDMLDDPYGGTSSYAKPRPSNDMDLAAGPSRPAPIPYDDPYSDAYGTAPPEFVSEEEEDRKPPLSPSQASRGHGRGRGRGRGAPMRDVPYHREEHGGGRGRGRVRNDRGRGRGRGRGRADPDHTARALSPTSFAIARATGQYADGSAVSSVTNGGGGGWGYPQYPMQSFDFTFPYQFPQVQPHINPRFASHFAMPGMGMGMGYSGYGESAPYTQDASGYAVQGDASGGWNGDWGDIPQPPPGQGGSGFIG